MCRQDQPKEREPISSLQEARSDVQRTFSEAVAIVTGETVRSCAEVEAELWTRLLALGRALMTLYLIRAAARPRPAEYQHAGIRFAISGTEESPVGTRFGKVPFNRAVGRAVGSKRGARDFPVDRQLGLVAGFTLGVVSGLGKLGVQMAFAAARRTFKDVYEWVPSPRAFLRMIDGMGAHARAFLEQAPAPEDDGDVMVILADGKGAPSISSTELARRKQPHRQKKTHKTKRRERRSHRKALRADKPRREPGDKSKNAKMAGVGVIYTLRRRGGELEGPINKRVIATFESYRSLFELLAAEAKKRGLGTSRIRQLLFIADGADTLWDLQREFFPTADMCIDWYHIVEKLWSCGKALFRNDRPRVDAWVAEQKGRLRHGKLSEVLQALELTLAATPLTGPGNKLRRARLTKTHAHFTKNAARMEYDRLRAKDFDIGSGVVEGMVRHLLGMRLDGPGMRWGRARAESVLLLRCILINGQWDDFVTYLAGLERLSLPAQPVATRTHDAKRKKAA